MTHKSLEKVLEDGGNRWEELNKGHKYSSMEAYRAKEVFIFGYLQSSYKIIFDALVTEINSKNKEFVINRPYPEDKTQNL